MVKDVLFDLDDTLFDFHADERVALERALSEVGVPFTDEVRGRYSVINEAQWKALERGEISREQVKKRRFELLFEELQKPLEQGMQVAESYPKYLAETFHYMPGAPELLELLYGNYRMFLVSNGNLSVQEGRLAKSGIGRYFEGIYISEVLGAEKPSKLFFDRAFSDVEDFDPAQAVIVGDSLTSDMQGGIAAGIHTIWFNPYKKAAHPDIKVDYEIAKLRELPELLQKL